LINLWEASRYNPWGPAIYPYRYFAAEGELNCILAIVILAVVLSVFGGRSIIVIESFGEEEEVKGRPATAIDPGQLLTAFKDFRLLHYQDIVAKADWGLEERRLVRMVAERRP
jgi:hypothetical protein